jgi:photosystem I subunit 11
MITNNAEKFHFLSPETTSTLVIKNSVITSKQQSELISPFADDIFVGHLSTPITTSNITKTYLSLLPAYKTGLSPLLRGINIGFTHGYFLLGPFVKLGPLRDSDVANVVGLVSTLSLIIILTACLIIYGFVTFSGSKRVEKNKTPGFLNLKEWNQFTAGFIVGGFGGSSIAYVALKLIGS